jgi:hypothetical protein
VIDRIAPVILIIATVVWALSVLLDAAPGLDYEPSPYVHTIMLGVVGIIATIYGVKKRNGRDGGS